MSAEDRMADLSRRLIAGEAASAAAQEHILTDLREQSKLEAVEMLGELLSQGGAILSGMVEILPMLEEIAEEGDGEAQHYREVGEAILLQSIERMDSIVQATIERLQQP